MSQYRRESAQKPRCHQLPPTPTSRYSDRYPLFERKPEVLAERVCNFSPSNSQAVRRADQLWEREPSRNDAQCEDMFEEELFDAEMHPVPAASLYDCIRNGVFLVNEAARHLDDLQQANKFSEAAFSEFVYSEAACGITKFDCEGLNNDVRSMRSGNFLTQWRINNFANRLMVNLGDLAQDWKERTQDNDNQKLTSLFRYILKNVTSPPNSIQKYSIRINGTGAKDKRLLELPRHIQETFLGFAEDFCGYGQPEVRLGRAMNLDESEFYMSLEETEERRAAKLKEKMADRLQIRNDAFRALQKALKDIRACKYEVDESNNHRWIPCSKQARRRDIQENSQSTFCDGTSENVAEFIDVEEM